MLKRKFISAIAGVLAFAATAPAVSAQGIDVTVNVPSGTQNVFTNNNGGAWGATITSVGPLLPTFVTDAGGLPIVYCIDQGRVFGLNTNLNMRLLTFAEFVANAPAVSPWSTTSFNDLNAMAALIGGYTPIASDATTRANNGAIQTQIWGLGTSATEVAPATNVSANWRVLVDRQDWTNDPAGIRTNGAQTFLVQVTGGAQVPEPASFALVGAGLVALVVVSRRRNTIA